MVYRDDRYALELTVAQLEAENDHLKNSLERAREQLQEVLENRDEQRRGKAREACVLCGGHLLPVAIFAGHDSSSPIPINMSTLRFSRPAGGFTHSAPIQSMACSSCGFIYNFVKMDKNVLDGGELPADPGEGGVEGGGANGAATPGESDDE